MNTFEDKSGVQAHHNDTFYSIHSKVVLHEYHHAQSREQLRTAAGKEQKTRKKQRKIQ